jgi:NAD(P)-dependent dehydrogenase (short-subunit alcohol dehydrogenase family)
MTVQDLLTLDGKTALVTGGSRGLGLQMAEALGEMGATVAITARKKDELDEAVSGLASRSIRSLAFVCDVGKREQIAPLVDAVLHALGRVDILVNNAGTTWGAPAEDHPVEAWDKLVNVNLTAAFLLSQQVAKRSMIPARWGRIINTASVAGLSASDPRVVRTVAYNATKHGLVGLTRQLAAEWGEHGITVNAICPGFFPSRMTRATLDVAGTMVLEGTPTKRLGNDEDLKGLVVLLASEASRHITGQAIAVDGGATLI